VFSLFRASTATTEEEGGGGGQNCVDNVAGVVDGEGVGYCCCC